MSTKKIIVGIAGGVAAYKTAMLVSRLVQEGFEVQALMTPSAKQFIGEATFSALTGCGVVTDMFDPRFPLGPHIELARDYDLLCIAPATANIIGKAAGGIADDLLSTLYMCFTGSVVCAPAMNCEMWNSKPVARNIETLRHDGVHFVGPNTGWLSCRVDGTGRMAEPDEIFETIKSLSN